jgi:hypothetical protein
MSITFRKFIKACQKGELEEAKAILLDNPDFNISMGNEEAFRYACSNSHLDVAQWLLQVNPDINISIYREEAFIVACLKGHLNVAQWLLQIKPSIDISAQNDLAFRYACEKGHLEVLHWLQSLRPFLYEVTDDGHCRVLTPAEQREAKRRYNITNTTNIGLVLGRKLPAGVADITRLTSEFLNVKGGKSKRKRTNRRRKTKRRRRNTKRSKK